MIIYSKSKNGIEVPLNESAKNLTIKGMQSNFFYKKLKMNRKAKF